MSILLITHENDIKSAQALLEVLIADKRNVKLFKFPQHEGLMRQEIEACSADCVVLVSPSSVSPDDRRADFIALGEQICANGNALSVFLRSAPKPPTWQCRDYPIPKVRSSNWLRRWILQDLEYKDVCTAILQKEGTLAGAWSRIRNCCASHLPSSAKTMPGSFLEIARLCASS
jgi:hypothetical protein